MSDFVSRYLDGLRGLEIGAATYNDYGLNARNVSDDDPFFTEAQHDRGVVPARVDIRADGANIPVASGSEDFVFSSHMIEHHPNPIAAIKEWYRIIKPNGYIIMVVPHRNALESDRDKPVESVLDLVDRWHSDYSGEGNGKHYTRFTPETMCRLIDWGVEANVWPSMEIVAVKDPDDQVGNGFIVVLWKPNKGGYE